MSEQQCPHARLRVTGEVLGPRCFCCGQSMTVSHSSDLCGQCRPGPYNGLANDEKSCVHGALRYPARRGQVGVCGCCGQDSPVERRDGWCQTMMCGPCTAGAQALREEAIRAGGFTIPHDWTFRSADVAAGFDRHVREQLPWYDLATGAVAHFVRHYLPHGGFLYDVGASTGNVGRACAETIREREATYVAAEPSAEMRDRFNPGLEAERVALLSAPAEDLQYKDDARPHVVVFFLSLSFVPLEHRAGALERAYAALRAGGVLLVLDKVDPPGGYWGQAVRRLTLAGKVAAGVPAAEIVAKELSLGGVQRPVAENVMQYCRLGDRPVREWFRFGEFAGWAVER